MKAELPLEVEVTSLLQMKLKTFRGAGPRFLQQETPFKVHEYRLVF